MFLKIILGIFFLIKCIDGSKSYENYKVYKLVPASDMQVQMIIDLKKDYDIWTDVIIVNSDVRILVSPEKEEEFVKYITSVGINCTMSVPNVQDLIRNQMKPAVGRSGSLGSFSWDRYHTIDEIHAWLDELPDLYPGIVTTVSIGRSGEGRNIKGVVIDFKSGQRENPYIGMLEGGTHSREWISPATVTWVIKEFLTSTDQDVRFMAEALVWHIFPVTNPDGYHYTFNGDRMWRKNRNPNHFTNCTGGNDLSNGVDLNRNFDFLWMMFGATLDPCSQTFAGPSPASELETRAVSSYVLSLKQTGSFIYYLGFHSYSQMILVPYSHLSGNDVIEVSNYADLFEIAARGAEKLKEKYGTDYQVGTSADILYEVSGSSFDWAKGVADIPIVYLFELRDVGEYGFLLPAEQIIPNNEEVMACLVEMDKTTRRLGYYSGAATNYISVFIVVISSTLLFMTQ